MNGTWLLIGGAIGFAAAALYVYRRGQHQINQQQPWPLESDGIELEIPRWVSQGNRAVIGQYEEVLRTIVECVHFEMWEDELPKHKDRDDPSYCETCGGPCRDEST